MSSQQEPWQSDSQLAQLLRHVATQSDSSHMASLNTPQSVLERDPYGYR